MTPSQVGASHPHLSPDLNCWAFNSSKPSVQCQLVVFMLKVRLGSPTVGKILLPWARSHISPIGHEATGFHPLFISFGSLHSWRDPSDLPQTPLPPVREPGE
jgi:hypothetical protein